VNAGHFKTVDDAARAAFWLLRDSSERRAQVRQELASRFNDLDEGKGIRRTPEEFAAFLDECEDKTRSRARG
jgi:hypothetical protein